MDPNFVLNKDTILDRLGGDEEIFKVLADMYLQDFENYCSDLTAALAAGDATRLQREAHTAKGVLATLDDEAGSGFAAALEARLKTGSGVVREEESVAALQARLRLVAAVVREAL